MTGHLTMGYSATRLDRLVSKKLSISKREVQTLIAQRRVLVNDIPASFASLPIKQFTRVTVDKTDIQNNHALYLMLNKPKGVVCATKDKQHKTVIDLLPYDFKDQLHIAGRLDLNSTGLVLLTNDGEWSRQLSDANCGVLKRYRVRLAKPISHEYIKAFAEGMHFAYENIHTRPVELKILSEFEAELSLQEGRYHQIKRMFGRFRNQVLALHRYAIGDYQLPPSILPGQSKQILPIMPFDHAN